MPYALKFLLLLIIADIFSCSIQQPYNVLIAEVHPQIVTFLLSLLKTLTDD